MVAELQWVQPEDESKLGKVVLHLIGLKRDGVVPSVEATDVSVASWNHIAVTYDDEGTTSIFLNGKLIDYHDVTSVSDPLLVFDSVHIGKIDLNADTKVRIREYRLWTCVLSEIEILRGMNSEVVFPAKGLEQYYKFADKSLDHDDSNDISTPRVLFLSALPPISLHSLP